MKAKDIMNRHFVSVAPEDPIQKVFETMTKNNTTGVAVLDKDQQLAGFIPESRLLVRGCGCTVSCRCDKHAHGVSFDPADYAQTQRLLYGSTAKDVMLTDPVAVDENVDIDAVVNTMLGKQVSRIPVLRRGKMIGLITRTDVLKAIMKMEEIRNEQESLTLTDDVIQKRVMDALHDNLGVSLMNLRLRVHKGQVTLTGQTESASDIKAIGEIVASIRGVNSVDNELMSSELLN